MIKIILSKNKKTNCNLIDDDKVLKDITIKIFKTANFVKEYDDRENGQYIKLFDTLEKVIYYVTFNNQNQSRNTRLVQPFPVAYSDYCEEKNNKKYIAIYFLKPETSDRTNYAKFIYRCLKTIGVKFLNFDILSISEQNSFQNYDDLKLARQQNREANNYNNSSFFMDDDTQITFYGKNDGVNSKESFILALAVTKVAHKKIVYYPVKNNISEKYKSILVENGITFQDTLQVLPNGKIKPANIRESSRNTAIFHYNLRTKFGDKQCYLCGCDLEHLVIGSHIERVSDIDKNPNYSNEEKIKRATDGDNGFWLCANHDKMFEYGIIYFEEQKMNVGKVIYENNQKNFIESSVFEMRKIYFNDIIGLDFQIKEEHFNENMKNYIEKHKKRTTEK